MNLVLPPNQSIQSNHFMSPYQGILEVRFLNFDSNRNIPWNVEQTAEQLVKKMQAFGQIRGFDYLYLNSCSIVYQLDLHANEALSENPQEYIQEMARIYLNKEYNLPTASHLLVSNDGDISDSLSVLYEAAIAKSDEYPSLSFSVHTPVKEDEWEISMIHNIDFGVESDDVNYLRDLPDRVSAHDKLDFFRLYPIPSQSLITFSVGGVHKVFSLTLYATICSSKPIPIYNRLNVHVVEQLDEVEQEQQNGRLLF